MFNLIERFLRQRSKKPAKDTPAAVSGVRAVLSHIYTLSVVVIGWVFFRVPGLKNGLHYLMSMFGLYNDPAACYLLPSYYLDRWTVCALVLGILMSTPFPKNLVTAINRKLPEPVSCIIRDIALLAALLLCILQVASNSYSAFIYFQF